MADVTWEELGHTDDGVAVQRYELRNGDLSASFLTLGATVQSLVVPDRAGRLDDVVLGFDDLRGYLSQQAFIGAVVGRYANRIAHGRFTLDGEEHQVPVSDRGHALHGGPDGFHRQVWTAAAGASADGPQVVLRHVSPHLSMGFPGTVEVAVTYTLMRDGLRIAYGATTDRPTVVNLTQHAYFNLSGTSAGTAEDHELTIHAGSYLPVDAGSIPLGGPTPVEGTPFDFRSPRRVGSGLRSADEQLRASLGYDHTWVLDAQHPGAGPTPAARLADPETGRVLEVSTDQPALQFYSGNRLDGSLAGKGGRTYRQSDGVCLETQAFPDAPNRPDFPKVTLLPGEELATTTVWRFSTT